jgi:hypothetical protein
MGLSYSQNLGVCQTHISECVHVGRMKPVICCWQSVSIGYTAHQRTLSVRDLKQIMSYRICWEKICGCRWWSYFGLLHVVVAKYSDDSKEDATSIFSIHPSMALQPLPSLGLPHKTPPFISIHSSSPPSSYTQQLQCILLNHIRPSSSWSSHWSCGVEVSV